MSLVEWSDRAAGAVLDDWRCRQDAIWAVVIFAERERVDQEDGVFPSVIDRRGGGFVLVDTANHPETKSNVLYKAVILGIKRLLSEGLRIWKLTIYGSGGERGIRTNVTIQANTITINICEITSSDTY